MSTRKPRAPKVAAPEPDVPKVRLTATEDPDVYVNEDGMYVDKDNVLVSLRKAKVVEAEVMQVVLDEEMIKTPANLLRAVALNPLLPLPVRMSAAKDAAPYFDRRMPLGLEGGDPNKPIVARTSVSLLALEAMSPEERRVALSVLEKLGVLDSAGGPEG